MFTNNSRGSGLPRSALITGLFVVQCACFVLIAWHRFVDGDEGFYLLASRLVLEHKRPYIDFFFTQAPLLPYVYGVWMRTFGVTWLSGKFLAALLTALLGSLLAAEVLRLTGRWLSAVAAVVLFASSTLIFAFYPVVKTYSLAGALLFGAYALVCRVSSEVSPWTLGGAGVLLGLSVSTRSYLVLTLPVLLWWILRNSAPTNRQKSILALLCGFGVGLVPCLYLFAVSPRAFLFNNLGYHALRSESGLLGMWQEKVFALLAVFLSGVEGNGLQTSLLLIACLALLRYMPKRAYPPRLALQMAIAIGLISLLPTPVHPQYFCLCIPFLLLTAVCAVTNYLVQQESGRTTFRAAVVCSVLVTLYVGASVGDFRRYLITGDNVPGLEPGLVNDYRLSRVLAVSRAVDQIAAPGETVASFWPGYIFQTHAEPLRGLESDFSLPIAGALDAKHRAAYSIVSAEDLEAGFAAHHPRVVVLRDHISIPTNVEFRQNVRMLEDRFRTILLAQGYVRKPAIGDIALYNFSNR